MLRTLALVILLDLVYFSLGYWFIYEKAIAKTYGASDKIFWFPALLAWCFVAVGVSMTRRDLWWTRATWGAVVFGVYNATTMSLTPHWPLGTALADTAWGALVFTLVPFLESKLTL